jgi:phosphatidylcholine synthase
MLNTRDPASTSSALTAWGVHVYTALGAVLAFLALVATANGDYRLAFLWMSAATFIDSTDGSLARRARVKEVLPGFDGARLDDIVDYLNFVLVPVVVAYSAGLVPGGFWGLLVCSLPLLASAYGFSQTDAKTADHFFKGFPSYWNIVVVYFYLLRTPLWFNVTTLLLFSVLVFVPILYLYPSRNPTARRTTHIFGAVWASCIILLILQIPQPSAWLAWLSLAFPAYYLGVSFYVHYSRKPF